MEVAIVGAGLAGIVSAIRLKQLGATPILIDYSLPMACGEIGGFAKFSGAKFSTPPAGMGLLKIAGSDEALHVAIEKVLSILEIEKSQIYDSTERNDTERLDCLRKYSSLVLSVSEMDDLIYRLKSKLECDNIDIINGLCSSVSVLDDAYTLTIDEPGSNKSHKYTVGAIFFAGGRLGAETILKMGIPPTDKRGLDVGFRVEFDDINGLASLRSHGPDAKIIKGNCRTFCLNVPGKIFRYPFQNISIPGGIVAGSEVNRSNVGVLLRSQNKTELLDHVIKKCESFSKDDLEKAYVAKGSIFGDASSLIDEIYGAEITDELKRFCGFLGSMGLVDWEKKHYIHLPLIDWHWDTFSLEKSFRTNTKNIYCIGDLSGHARGLLQAAVSGLLAVEEFSHEN